MNELEARIIELERRLEGEIERHQRFVDRGIKVRQEQLATIQNLENEKTALLEKIHKLTVENIGLKRAAPKPQLSKTKKEREKKEFRDLRRDETKR